jgi:hypothetical protein
MRAIRSTVVTTLLVSAGVLGLPSAAHASIWACYGLGVSESDSETSYCEGTKPSSFSQFIRCKYAGGSEYSVEGSHEWAGGGIGSTATCRAGSYVSYREVKKFP